MVKEKKISLPSIKNELDYLLNFLLIMVDLMKFLKNKILKMLIVDNKINVIKLAPLIRYNQQCYVI